MTTERRDKLKIEQLNVPKNSEVVFGDENYVILRDEWGEMHSVMHKDGKFIVKKIALFGTIK